MFIDYVRDRDSIFCILYNSSVLMKISANNGNVEWCESLGSSVQGMFNRVIDGGNNIVFVPSHAKEFLLVEKNNCKKTQIQIPNISISKRNYSFFGDGICYDGKIYAFGLSYPGIVKIESDNGGNATLVADVSDANSDGFVADNCVVGHTIYLPFSKANGILKFDLLTENSEIIITKALLHYKTIAFDGKEFWMITNDGCVFKYDTDFEPICRSYKLEKAIQGKRVSKSIFWKDQLYLFFESIGEILKYSILNDEYIWLFAPNRGNGLSPVYYVTLKESGPCFYSECMDNYYMISDDGLIVKENFVNELEYTKSVMKEVKQISENDNLSLQNYIACI